MDKRNIFFIAVSILILCANITVAVENESSPYGVHSHVTRGDEHRFLEGEFELMKQADIKWLRTGFVWASIMKQDGTFDFVKQDKVVTEAQKYGISIMGLLHGAPGWAKPINEHHKEWLEFVKKTVTRYKSKVPAWQVWNEPNIGGFWENPNPDHYAALLKPTYKLIKSIDPDAKVVFGGNSQYDWNFMERVMELAGDSFDIMAVHPYGYDLIKAPEAYIPQTIAEIKVQMKSHGINRPIWFTEWGWPTHNGRSGMPEWQQATHIVRAHILAFTAGLERGFWYEFQATERKEDVNEDHFGIVHFDLKPKPAYNALKTLIKMRPAGSKTLDGAYCNRLFYYPGWKRPDGKIIYAFWDVYGRWAKQRKQYIKFEGSPPEVFDMDGNPVKLEVDEKNKTAVLLPEWAKPRYLVCTGRIELVE